MLPFPSFPPLSSLLPFLFLLLLFHSSAADVTCPTLPHGVVLNCAQACCRSHEGANQGFYCCDPADANVVARSAARAERFSTVYSSADGIHFGFDWSLLLLGLLLSILLSVLLSFLCCLLCNGCWLHRRRNPQMYENVGERDDGFYHICCGFGIPVGTVVFSTHPPQFADGYGGGSPMDRSRVRFDEERTPRGVLKNGNEGQPPMSNGGYR